MKVEVINRYSTIKNIPNTSEVILKFDDLKIMLKEDDYNSLLSSLDEKLKEEHNNLKTAENKIKQKKQKLKDLSKEILTLYFGEGFENDPWLLTREVKEIEQKDFDNLLYKYEKFLET